MQRLLKGCRTALHVLTCLIIFIAMVLTFVAIIEPDWQILKQGNNRHRHGLWQDCSRNVDKGRAMGAPDIDIADVEKVPYMCELKDFSKVGEKEIDELDGRITGCSYHTAKYFQLHTLILLTCAALFAVPSFICCMVSAYSDCLSYRPIYKCMAIGWLICHTLAFVLTSAAMIVFAMNTYDIKQRSVKYYTQMVDQEWGSSFWLGVAANVLILISYVLGIICVIGLFLYANTLSPNRKYTYVRVDRKKQPREAVPIVIENNYDSEDDEEYRKPSRASQEKYRHVSTNEYISHPPGLTVGRKPSSRKTSNASKVSFRDYPPPDPDRYSTSEDAEVSTVDRHSLVAEMERAAQNEIRQLPYPQHPPTYGSSLALPPPSRIRKESVI